MAVVASLPSLFGVWEPNFVDYEPVYNHDPLFCSSLNGRLLDPSIGAPYAWKSKGGSFILTSTEPCDASEKQLNELCHERMTIEHSIDKTNSMTRSEDPYTGIQPKYRSQTHEVRPYGRAPSPVSSDDMLLSSTESDIEVAAQTHNRLCSLCRQPFETGEEIALVEHFAKHASEFEKGFTCEVCKATFAFKADLEWHKTCATLDDWTLQRGRRVKHAAPSVHNMEIFNNSRRLLEWERAQIQAHSEEVDAVCNRPTFRRHSSVPPRERRSTEVESGRIHLNGFRIPNSMPLKNNSTSRGREEDFAQHPNSHCKPPIQPRSSKHDQSTCSDETAYKNSSAPDAAAGNIRTAIDEIQKRIRGLMERLVPETVNTPGTPSLLTVETPQSFDSLMRENEPGSPERADDSAAPLSQAAPSDANNAGAGRYGVGSIQNARPGSRGPNQANDKRNFNDGDDDCNAGRDSNPKRRKIASVSSLDDEKKFPCICYVGEPDAFPNDMAKHKHISNMCRHLKSHDFYACSTCIVQFSSDEELDIHLGCHIRNCRRKGCKRQRPAFEPEPAQCDHIMTAEDQWRALYMLKYDQQPPNIFGIHDATGTCLVAPTPVSNAEPIDNDDYSRVFGTPNLQSEMAQTLVDTTPSFGQNDEQSPFDSVQRLPPDFDMDEFLMPEILEEPAAVPQHSAMPHFTSDTSVDTQNLQSNLQEPSVQMLVEALQKQVTSLEKKLESQTTDDRNRIFSLQSQVAQLEQKLFQSSARVEQLEATLAVVFEAFKATGAPQAQPNKPLWKLVTSHSSQAAGPVSTGSQSARAVPALEIETAQFLKSFGNGKQGQSSVMTRSDSAYGSVR